MQLEGSKQWSFGKKINQTPRHDFRPFWDDSDYQALSTINLNPGEILYLPPGLWHQTKTVELNNSLHLALGVTMPDWYDMLKVYMTYIMKKHYIFREHIPFIIEDDVLNFKDDLDLDILSLLDLMKQEITNYDWYKDIAKEVKSKP